MIEVPSVHSVHMSIINSTVKVAAPQLSGTLNSHFIGSLMKVIFSSKFVKRLKKENLKLFHQLKMPDLKKDKLLESSVVILMPNLIQILVDKVELVLNWRIKSFNVNNKYFKEVINTVFMPFLTEKEQVLETQNSKIRYYNLLI